MQIKGKLFNFDLYICKWKDERKVGRLRLFVVYSNEKKSGLAGLLEKRRKQIDNKKESTFIEELIAFGKKDYLV